MSGILPAWAIIVTLSASPIGSTDTMVQVPRDATPGVVLAQREVSIPSDAQLERMEQRGIAANSPNDRGARGNEEAEIREMNRRAHRIDEQLLKDSDICAGCK
jgi:hypothetical protein